MLFVIPYHEIQLFSCRDYCVRYCRCNQNLCEKHEDVVINFVRTYTNPLYVLQTNYHVLSFIIVCDYKLKRYGVVIVVGYVTLSCTMILS